MHAASWPPVAEYDYSYNIVSLYKAFNTFRMNLTVLELFAQDQEDKRLIGHSINGHVPKTYACLDYYATLNPFGVCGWRGILKNLPGFWKEIREQKNDGYNLKALKWSNDLAQAASDYLKDLEGCRSIPDQIGCPREKSHFLDNLHIDYSAHHRSILMPMRFPW